MRSRINILKMLQLSKPNFWQIKHFCGAHCTCSYKTDTGTSHMLHWFCWIVWYTVSVYLSTFVIVSECRSLLGWNTGNLSRSFWKV